MACCPARVGARGGDVRSNAFVSTLVAWLVVLLVLERAEETFERSNASSMHRQQRARAVIVAPAHEDVLRRVGVVASFRWRRSRLRRSRAWGRLSVHGRVGRPLSRALTLLRRRRARSRRPLLFCSSFGSAASGNYNVRSFRNSIVLSTLKISKLIVFKQAIFANVLIEELA